MTMEHSPACTALVKQFEGCRLDAYPDPGTSADPWTIGYGATGPGIKAGVRWTQAQAESRLESDLSRFSRGVAALLGKDTTQNRFDALVSFAFNVGLGNLQSSSLLRMHNAGNYAAAQGQFARWNKAAGKVMNGLTRRRAAEATLYGSAL